MSLFELALKEERKKNEELLNLLASERDRFGKLETELYVKIREERKRSIKLVKAIENSVSREKTSDRKESSADVLMDIMGFLKEALASYRQPPDLSNEGKS